MPHESHLRIEKIKEVIRQIHGADSVHLATEHVEEELPENGWWRGNVEVFALLGRPKAVRCYAWSCEENGNTQWFVPLALKPGDSARAAVRAAIASGKMRLESQRSLR